MFITNSLILHVLHMILALAKTPFLLFPGFATLGLSIAIWNARNLPQAPLWQNLCLCTSVLLLTIESRRIIGRLQSGDSFFQLQATRLDVALMAWLITSVIFDFRWDRGYLDADVWMAESTCNTSREFRVWSESGESELTSEIQQMLEDGQTTEEIRKVADDWRRQDKAFRVWRKSGERVKSGIVKEMLNDGYAINRLREISRRIEEDDTKTGDV